MRYNENIQAIEKNIGLDSGIEGAAAEIEVSAAGTSDAPVVSTPDCYCSLLVLSTCQSSWSETTSPQVRDAHYMRVSADYLPPR